MNQHLHTAMTRRAALTNMGIGLGSLAAHTLLAEAAHPNLQPIDPTEKTVITILVELVQRFSTVADLV